MTTMHPDKANALLDVIADLRQTITALVDERTVLIEALRRCACCVRCGVPSGEHDSNPQACDGYTKNTI